MATDLVKMIGAYLWIASPVPEYKVHIAHSDHQEDRSYEPGKVKVLCGKAFVTGDHTWRETPNDQYNHKICMQCYDLLRLMDAAAAIYALRKLLAAKKLGRDPAIVQHLDMISNAIKHPTSLQFTDMN